MHGVQFYKAAVRWSKVVNLAFALLTGATTGRRRKSPDSRRSPRRSSMIGVPPLPAAENAGRALKVFLCHSSADKAVVQDLYRKLLKDGFDPWLDKERLLPGQLWLREIPRAVDACDVFVVCLSSNWVDKRGWIQKEIGLALAVAEEQPEGTIYLIPLRLDDCRVPSRLTEWQCVDYCEQGGYERLVKALNTAAASLAVGQHG